MLLVVAEVSEVDGHSLLSVKLALVSSSTGAGPSAASGPCSGHHVHLFNIHLFASVHRLLAPGNLEGRLNGVQQWVGVSLVGPDSFFEYGLLKFLHVNFLLILSHEILFGELLLVEAVVGLLGRLVGGVVFSSGGNVLLVLVVLWVSLHGLDIFRLKE